MSRIIVHQKNSVSVATNAASLLFARLFVLLVIIALTTDAQKSSGKLVVGAPEMLIDAGDAPEFTHSAHVANGPSRYADNNDALSKAEGQLLGAIELLEAYREAAPMPMKFAEKRRNKFEFIRFG